MAILDAALEVFAEGGYRGGSLKSVAAKVGMSEAGLLHHFPSKAMLLAAVLERRDELSFEYVPLEATDGTEVLVGLVRLARFNAHRRGIVDLYCTLSAEATSKDHPAHDYFVERYAWTRHTLGRSFANLEERGLLRDGVEAPWATAAIIALMDGLQVQWLMDPESVDMADSLLEFLGTITRADLSAAAA
ncbi:TetR/AcrR family transcriptional regulator [Nocardioides sp. GY 10127]|uniref:TetR/AcrR family transcriptional regulator n=1 Tax=Nocardioides sp. GY 10127 TaxID=2569762 RepID=UPI00197DE70C|nr:TetR/AcrR family transcriptional regulator [Nocardioides sp. GY 10127]